MAQRLLEFDKGFLTLYDEDGNVLYCRPASAGRPGETDETKENIGPLPHGTYTLYPAEISDSLVAAVKRNVCDGDWGLGRVPLHPNPETYMGTRENFFVHGGVIPGSAGCIDAGTPNELELFELLKRSDEPVEVRVSTTPNNWDREIIKHDPIQPDFGWGQGGGSELDELLVEKKIAERQVRLYGEESTFGKAAMQNYQSKLAEQFPNLTEVERNNVMEAFEKQARREPESELQKPAVGATLTQQSETGGFDFHKALAEHMALNDEIHAKIDAQRAPQEQDQGLSVGRA